MLMNKRSATYVQTMTRDSILNQVEAARASTTLALLFHTHDNKLQAVTAHGVATRSKGLQIMPGRPLSPEDELSVVNLLQRPETEGKGLTFLPEHILLQDRFSTLWWVPSSIRPMYLHPTSGKRKTIKVRWPTLALYAVNRKLYIVGLEKDERPTPSTKVFHAPLANVWQTSQICTGGAKLPISCDTSSIPEWEDVVFATGFSHKNHDVAIRRAGGRAGIDPMTFWPKRDKKTGAFPATQLTPLHMTMGKWLASVRGAA